MSKFTVTDIFGGLKVIEPREFKDARGSFMELYNIEDFKNIPGLPTDFKQFNHSISKKGVLRGMHFQKKHPQGKLVTVVHGSVYDVAIDIREDSETYGKWFGVELTGENRKMFWIPGGFAHGFISLADHSDFIYFCDEIRYADDEYGISWKSFGVEWPEEPTIISEKDQKHQIIN
jgi:dTDP-4-dehydrorhamnose 3,5-epimerase